MPLYYAFLLDYVSLNEHADLTCLYSSKLYSLTKHVIDKYTYIAKQKTI